MTFVKAVFLGIPDIRSKISCGQVDMTFIKAAWQLKIVLGYMIHQKARSKMCFCIKLLQAVSANGRRNLLAVI